MVKNKAGRSGIPAAIFGGHGSGAIIAEALRDLASAGRGLAPPGFLNDVEPVGAKIDGLPVLGRFEDWRAMPDETIFITAIHKPMEAEVRWARIRGLGVPDERWATVIHPSAHVADSVRIGHGTYIGPNAVVMPGVTVGRHASLRAGCYVSHDVTIGDFGFVGPNAVVSGRSSLGEGIYFGPAASCREEITIGVFSVVGVGAVVVSDVSHRTTVCGNPARTLRKACSNSAEDRLILTSDLLD